MSASLLSRLETADISADRMPLFDELRTTTLDCPDRIGPFLHIIKPAFCDRLRSLRGLAYMCAFDYVCANPSMAEHFTSAYLAALLHHEADISLHALSYLPEFIKVCQSTSRILLDAATIAAKRWPSPDSTADLARAVSAFRFVELDEHSNSQSVK